MSRSLIIDARHRLRWHQRLLSDASTAILWSGWLLLWAPLLRAYASLAHLGARVSPALAKLHLLGSDDGLQYSLAALLGASGTLVVWNRLPARRACAAPPPSLREYARHFDLPEHELRAGHEAAVCVVHHDEHGRIVRLERRDPPRRAARRSA
jgi:poly-beta-1,6-N-acetyl-D-glucosamine biosynthesis protein PgaD